MLVDYVRVYKPNQYKPGQPEKTLRTPTAPGAPYLNSRTPTTPGAPYLESEMWASSEGRPFSSPSRLTSSAHKTPGPAESTSTGLESNSVK
jgi:hypothetical protein